jgi:hypothetical protein
VALWLYAGHRAKRALFDREWRALGPEAGDEAEDPTTRQCPGLKFEGALTASRRATGSMLFSAQGSMGACIMDAVALVVFIISIFFAGRIAERQGRSFKIWAWIAAFIGPLALALVLLFPNLHGNNGDHAQGC